MGDPVLHTPSQCVVNIHDTHVAAARRELHAGLAAFRAAHGFGRGMAAPQVGHNLRMIACNLGHPAGAFTLHNPVLLALSSATITMWDDCMSFPDLLVRVRRSRTCDVQFTDDRGQVVVWRNVDTALAELLQHEVDHLDGLTAFDRMVPAETPGAGGGGASLRPRVVYRREYDAHRQLFDAMVDYTIKPTV
jgi:peptide deformylase